MYILRSRSAEQPGLFTSELDNSYIPSRLYDMFFVCPITRSILHGYFNPLVFWYQWDYLLTSKDFFVLQGV